MMPAFGFSVGDFIAAIGLIAKVSKAVKDEAGASKDYQDVILELQALKRALLHLQALQPTESNVEHVNAIRGMALTCRIPLQSFLDRVQKYESTLGPFSMRNKGSLRSVGRKSQWAVFMSGEVAELRTAIGAKVLSILLLLATHTSESISRIESEAYKSHATLLASILEQRTSIEKLDKKLEKSRSSTKRDLKSQAERMEKFANQMDDASETLRRVSDSTESIKSAVMSFRTMPFQLLQLIHSFPAQIRGTLGLVVQSNMQMYTMLKAIHSSILRSPTSQPADSVSFEDVLGRTKFLPYEYFRHVEVFNSYLKTQFKGLPGEQKVLQRKYLILDANSDDHPISEEEWKNVVFPGASLVMSALMEQMGGKVGQSQCPRIGCNGFGSIQRRPAFRTCDKCGMEFAPRPDPRFPPAQKAINRPSKRKNATRQSSHMAKPVEIKAESDEQQPGQDRAADEEEEETEFWESSLGPSERTKRELRIFRRVHLQPLSPFMRTMNSVDKSHFQTFDVEHTRAKFPRAPEYLVERLGRAISRRRQYLSYCEEARVERHISRIGDAGLSRRMHTTYLDPSDKETYASQSSYAPPHPSGVPPLPREFRQKSPHECPICFRVISIHSTRAWECHLYRDLHPYLCMFQDCETGDRMYHSRDAWWKHELEAHCATADAEDDFECPLCDGDDLHRHRPDLCMSIHLEELALFALPLHMSVYEDEPEDEEDNGQGSEQENGISFSSYESHTTASDLPSDFATFQRSNISLALHQDWPEDGNVDVEAWAARGRAMSSLQVRSQVRDVQ